MLTLPIDCKNCGEEFQGAGTATCDKCVKCVKAKVERLRWALTSLDGIAANWLGDKNISSTVVNCAREIREITKAVLKCPACSYYAFNGEDCFSCGYRP